MKGVIDQGKPRIRMREQVPAQCICPAPGRIMKKMKDVPEHDRPREKIAKKGVVALTDTELIEAILGRGIINRDVRMIARDIAAMLGDHTREIRYEDVLAIGGIGPTKAAQIMACLELGRRMVRTGR